MWQLLLAAAAAAGSGILAKKLINLVETEKPVSGFEQHGQECDQNTHLRLQDLILNSDDACQGSTSQEKRESAQNEGENIFRFSSLEMRSKEWKKKTRSGFRGPNKNGVAKRGKNGGPVLESGGKDLAVDQRGNGSGKRFSVCLKKRRTGKQTAGKCESCASKDKSFGWGVGIGIMYMMSAGKAEISRLNSAMDETGKIVQELKDEIFRRKRSCNVHTFVAGNESETNSKHIEGSSGGPLFAKSGGERKYNVATFGPSLIGDGECGSSCLMEGQKPEVLEMDRLEAELETEMQKLPWGVTESSGSEGRQEIFETEALAREHQSEDCWNSNLHPYNGVLPGELDKRLCHVLIEQQGSQIAELEAELYQAQSKLHEKEVELQALKNCVKRLSEFSLASASDEETADKEDARTRDGIEEQVGFEPTKSVVGMKRTMGYDSPSCSSS